MYNFEIKYTKKNIFWTPYEFLSQRFCVVLSDYDFGSGQKVIQGGKKLLKFIFLSFKINV